MDLNINYSATRDVGGKVQTKGNEFQDLLSKINSVNSQLQSYWAGQDASKYSQAVAEQAKYMQQLSETITEIGAFLVKVGDAYEEAMERNKSGINM